MSISTSHTVPTYNVFQRKRRPALRCAIRQDKPVPAFISSEIWDFRGTVRTAEPLPAGFQPAEAWEATRFSGYYLFHALHD